MHVQHLYLRLLSCTLLRLRHGCSGLLYEHPMTPADCYAALGQAAHGQLRAWHLLLPVPPNGLRNTHAKESLAQGTSRCAGMT